MECWEFLNNTSDTCLFKAADFDAIDVDGKGNRLPQRLNDLEGRFLMAIQIQPISNRSGNG